jgi:hypothetical protein
MIQRGAASERNQPRSACQFARNSPIVIAAPPSAPVSTELARDVGSVIP